AGDVFRQGLLHFGGSWPEPDGLVGKADAQARQLFLDLTLAFVSSFPIRRGAGDGCFALGLLQPCEPSANSLAQARRFLLPSWKLLREQVAAAGFDFGNTRQETEPEAGHSFQPHLGRKSVSARPEGTQLLCQPPWVRAFRLGHRSCRLGQGREIDATADEPR